MPGANGFGYFPRKESNPRRGTARKKAWMSCFEMPSRQVFLSPCQVLAHLASLSRKRARGQTVRPAAQARSRRLLSFARFWRKRYARVRNPEGRRLGHGADPAVLGG